ncbi:MAG: thioredoxin family protein [Bacteroidota bacterium]
MALTYSNMMELGTNAPDFDLLDTVSGEYVSLPDTNSAKAVVVMFICNHCPYVHHVNQKMVEIANAYSAQGAKFIGISSNDVNNYPQDGPELMKETAQREGYPFPYLYDETQEVAKAYGAECTPDFFVFDSDLKCVYRGRMDETRPGMGTPNGNDLKSALEAVLAGEKPNDEQFPSMGCGIKWKN